MKVKVGNIIYDSNKEPIVIILSNEDKKNISNMSEGNFKYCCFTDNINIDKIKDFMKD
jgi:hypothetical protein